MARQYPLELTRQYRHHAHMMRVKLQLPSAFFFYTGKNHKLGEVHDGAATMDWMEQEQGAGHYHYLRRNNLHLARTPYQYHRHPRGMWTLPLRWNVLCAYWTVRLPYFAPKAALSRNPKLFGVSG